MRKIVLLALALVFATIALVHAGDSDLFAALFEEVNNIVTPKFPVHEAYKAPQEIFLMNLPGQTINPDDFDVDVWRANNFEDTDPEYNAFLITDSIPVSSLPYYVDSGKKVSNMYRRFLENYITDKRKIQSEESIEKYKKALKRVLNDDYTPSPLAVYVNQTRTMTRESYNTIVSLRNECLNNENFGICARKAVYWGEGVQDNHMLYMVTQKELLAAQAKIMSLQFRSFDLILMQAYQQYLSSSRSCVGAKSFLGDYMQTRYEPADFWKWWRPNNTLSTFNTAFTAVKIESSSETKTESATLSKTSWNFQASFNIGFVKFSTSNSYSSTRSTFQATANGEKSIVRFEVASVKVQRPWFDGSLFDLAPLGIDGAPKFYWSDGNYRGTFPWFISKMIIAKNVYIEQSSWSSDIRDALETTKFDTASSFSYGPFACGGRYSSDNSRADSSKEFKFDGSTLEVGGPQIIGYVMTRISPFPNWDNGKYNLKSL